MGRLSPEEKVIGLYLKGYASVLSKPEAIDALKKLEEQNRLYGKNELLFSWFPEMYTWGHAAHIGPVGVEAQQVIKQLTREGLSSSEIAKRFQKYAEMEIDELVERAKNPETPEDMFFSQAYRWNTGSAAFLRTVREVVKIAEMVGYSPVVSIELRGKKNYRINVEKVRNVVLSR